MNENPEDADDNENLKDIREHIPEFTKQELQEAIDYLKNGNQEKPRESKRKTSKNATTRQRR